MIDSIECLLLPEDPIEAIKYNKYKLIYGKENNFYDFDTNNFI